MSLNSITGLILVINGKSPRLTIDMLTTLTKLRGVIPDEYKNNIFVVFTRCKSVLDREFDLKSLPFSIDEKLNLFYVDNCAFQHSAATIASDPMALRVAKQDWSNSMKMMGNLVVRLTQSVELSTQPLKQLKASRDELQSALCTMRLEMMQLQDAQTQLDEVEKMMNQAQADQSQFAAFTKMVAKKERKMVDVDYHSTICGSCISCCHDHCGLEEIATKGDAGFKRCSAFNGGDNCRVCNENCSFSEHFHDKKKIVEEELTVEEVLEDIKAKYDNASGQLDDAKSKLGGLADARKMVEQGISALVKKVQDACNKIRAVCSHFNLAAELQISVRQLQAEKSKLANINARETADKFIATIVDIIDSLGEPSPHSATNTSNGHKQTGGGSGWGISVPSWARGGK